MTATEPDMWQETALIGIIPEGDSEIQFACITEDITGLDFGDKEIEGLPTVCGGRLMKITPQADETITMKMYPINANVDDGGSPLKADGIVQLFHPQSAEDSSEPILVDNTRTRSKFGIILLWSTTLPATAGAQPAAGQYAYRIQIINAYMTSYKLNYDDKVLSAEVTFKWGPFDKDGSANKREESVSGTSGQQLPAGITSATSF